MAGSDIHRLARSPFPKSSKNTWKCLDPACEICFQSLRYKFHTSFLEISNLNVNCFLQKKKTPPRNLPIRAVSGPYPSGHGHRILMAFGASPRRLPGPELFRTMVQSSTRPGNWIQRGVCQQWSWFWIQLLGSLKRPTGFFGWLVAWLFFGWLVGVAVFDCFVFFFSNLVLRGWFLVGGCLYMLFLLWF